MITTLIFATIVASPPSAPMRSFGPAQDRASSLESRPPIDERVFIQIARMQQSKIQDVRDAAPDLKRRIQYWLNHLKGPMDDSPESPKLEADVKLLSQILDEVEAKGFSADIRAEFDAVVSSFGGIRIAYGAVLSHPAPKSGDSPPTSASVSYEAVGSAPRGADRGSTAVAGLPSFMLIVKIANPEPYQTAYRIWYRPTNEFGLPAYTYTTKQGKNLLTTIKREPNINYYIWVNRFREGDSRRGLVLASETELSVKVIR